MSWCVGIILAGAGNDTYGVDSLSDAVIEALNAGTDTVQPSLTWTLGPQLENLTLTGVDNLDATGNELNNLLIGNAGNNVLDGRVDADTTAGGAGNDIYLVDNPGDQVIESQADAADTVNASVSYTLTDHVENLTLTGTDNIDGAGSAQDNTLIGNVGINVLAGGRGNDTYTVQTAGDVVIEHAGEGIDAVDASVSFTLGDHVENPSLTGDAISGTGNALDNTLYGNDLDNVLEGADGNDHMVGRRSRRYGVRSAAVHHGYRVRPIPRNLKFAAGVEILLRSPPAPMASGHSVSLSRALCLEA